MNGIAEHLPESAYAPEVTVSRSFAVLFVLGGAVAFGCSNQNEPNAEDGATGDFDLTTCLSVCERARGCPNAAPLDCAESCSALEIEPCAPQSSVVLDCLSRTDVCDPLPPECVDEIDDYNLCLENVDTGGGCSPESAPASAGCAAICAGGPFSCFESEAACVESCSNALARSELVTCSGEYQATLGCISTCADICALSGDDCAETRGAFLECDARYCEANPDSEPCRIETI